MPRYLTKSKFLSAVECPTKLFYLGKKEYKNTKNEDSFLASLAEGGYQIGALAKFLHPKGVEVFEREHETAVQITSELLESDNIVIFEAAIKYEDFFIRVDILEKINGKLNIYEAKAKSYNSLNPQIEGKLGGILKPMLPYLQDVAFQTWVLKNKFPEKEINSYLVMPDKTESSDVDGLNQMFKINQNYKITLDIPTNVDMAKEANKLLVKLNVNDLVSFILNTPLSYPGGPNSFDSAINEWSQHNKEDNKIKPSIGGHCKNCEFKSEPSDASYKSGFHECWKETLEWGNEDFNDGLVLDIYVYLKKDKIIRQGLYKLKQVQRNDLAEFSDEVSEEGLKRAQRQWLQINGIPKDYDYGNYFFDKAYFESQHNKWNYPLHLIDFETTKVALPFFKGMKPYQSIAFQFSHHILNEDGSVAHADQFLCAEPGDFPSYKFVRALKDALNRDNGSIFMWHHHENSILTSILEQITNDKNTPNDMDVLCQFIRSVIKGGEREMIDLCRISDKCFYYKDTKGSSSLKKVLPALFKTSKYLRDFYSKPIYGSPDGMKSINFKSDKGFIWINKEINDPYYLLKDVGREMLPEEIDDSEDDESIIAEGGAAAIAYSRLQFEDLNVESRERIKNGLLRYCELDTLAMVMALQAWKELI